MRKPRRTDGICPDCGTRPRINHSYCAACNNRRRRDERAGKRPPLPPVVRDANGLLPIQVSILRHMCNGLESRQIAERIGFSINYIKQRRAQMLNITGCINSHHLTAWAALNGYASSMDGGKSQRFSDLAQERISP